MKIQFKRTLPLTLLLLLACNPNAGFVPPEPTPPPRFEQGQGQHPESELICEVNTHTLSIEPYRVRGGLAIGWHTRVVDYRGTVSDYIDTNGAEHIYGRSAVAISEDGPELGNLLGWLEIRADNKLLAWSPRQFSGTHIELEVDGSIDLVDFVDQNQIVFEVSIRGKMPLTATTIYGSIEVDLWSNCTE